MAQIHSHDGHDECQADHPVSKNGVCNLSFLSSQLHGAFKNRLATIGTTEIKLEAFQDVLPDEPEQHPPPAGFQAVTPTTPVDGQAPPTFDQGAQPGPPAPPGDGFNQGGFSQGGFQEVGPDGTLKPISSGFTSGGFGDENHTNWGEAPSEDFIMPPPGSGTEEQHGFQPPKWAEILLPVNTDLKSGHPQNYRIPIKIGETTFEPMLDTGSSLLWVPAKLQAEDKVPPGLPFYKPATAIKKGKKPPLQQISYGSGTIKYRPWSDTVSIANTNSPMFPFGGAVNLDEESETGYGILGLSPQTPIIYKDGVPINKSFNLIWALQRMGEIRAPVCSFIGPNIHSGANADPDKTDTKQNRGYLAIGRLRKQFYKGDLSWCDIVAPKQDKWLVPLDEVCINGVPLPTRPRLALIDTGMSYVAAPSKDFDDVIKALPNAKAVTDAEDFFSVRNGDLKTVTFKLGVSALGLRPEDLYIGKMPTEEPKPGETPSTEDRVIASIVRKPEQFGGVEAEYWVLGGIFLDNVVTSFLFGDEYSKSMIGFAEVNDTDFANWQPGEEDPFDMS